MTLIEYEDTWATEAPLALDNLDRDLQNIPRLHARWWKYYTIERQRYQRVQNDYKQLYRQRWEYFAGKLDDDERTKLGWPPQPLRILSQNMDVYLSGDPVMQAELNKKFAAEETCKFIEDVLKSIHNRGYLIKTTVDFLRFKNGQ